MEEKIHYVLSAVDYCLQELCGACSVVLDDQLVLQEHLYICRRREEHVELRDIPYYPSEKWEAADAHSSCSLPTFTPAKMQKDPQDKGDDIEHHVQARQDHERADEADQEISADNRPPFFNAYGEKYENAEKK